MKTNKKKNIEDIEGYINSKKIIAVRLEDLLTIKVLEEKENVITLAKPEYSSSMQEYKNNITFLYKKDKDKYIEYFTKRIITTEKPLEDLLNTKDIITDSKLLTNAKKSLTSANMIVKTSSFTPLNIDIKNDFMTSLQHADDIRTGLEEMMNNCTSDFENVLEELDHRQKLCEVYTMANDQELFIFPMIRLKRAMLSINKSNSNDLKNRYHIYTSNNIMPENSNEKYNFNNAYGILVKISDKVYKEYYSGEEIVVLGNTSDEIKINDNPTIRDISELLTFFKDHPLVLNESYLVPLNINHLNELKNSRISAFDASQSIYNILVTENQAIFQVFLEELYTNALIDDVLLELVNYHNK